LERRAKKLLTPVAAPFAGLGVRLRKVLSPGHVTVGLFVVANAAPGLPPAIAEYLRSGADRAMLSYPYYPLARLLGVVLQLAIGLWLFLGTETLTGWLRKTRQAR
jgi:hypothetical protein